MKTQTMHKSIFFPMPKWAMTFFWIGGGIHGILAIVFIFHVIGLIGPFPVPFDTVVLMNATIFFSPVVGILYKRALNR